MTPVPAYLFAAIYAARLAGEFPEAVLKVIFYFTDAPFKERHGYDAGGEAEPRGPEESRQKRAGIFYDYADERPRDDEEREQERAL